MSVRGFVWVFLGAAACGSVSDNKGLPDAPPAGDAMPPVADPGSLRWVRSLASLEALGVVDGPGGLVVTGSLVAPADLGGGVLTPVGGLALVVAGYNADDASHLYSVRHGGAGNIFPFVHAVTAAGAPIVNGVSYGDVDLGKGAAAGGTPGNTALADGYIGVYGPGTPAWVQRIVGSGEDKIVAVAQGPGSSVYGAGWYEGAPTFNGAVLPTARGRDLFVARFDQFTGAVQLTRTFGSAGREEISGAARAGDALVIAGSFDTALAFDALSIQPRGGLDAFVTKLDATGKGVWAAAIGGAVGDDRDPRVVVDGAGDVYVAATFTGEITIGAVTLAAHGKTDVDIFLAKLRGSDGSVAWAVSLGAPPAPPPAVSTDAVADLAVDSAGHVVLAGSVTGSLDGKPAAGGLDAFFASFDAGNGTLRWRDLYGTDVDDRAFAVAIGRNGDVYGVVDLGGPYNFGTPIIGAANPSAVLLRLAP